MRIFVSKTKVVAFRGKTLVRSKIIVDNKMLVLFSHFQCLSCVAVYDFDQEVENNLNRF